MQRLAAIGLGLVACGGVVPAPARGQAPASSPAATGQAPAATAQAGAVRAPGAAEVRLLQALRANPATAPFPFSTEPAGSKVVLRGVVGAKIVHDVAVRTAIDLGIPIVDAIAIDTAFNPPGRGGFGPVAGPGPTLAGGSGFGGPPAFGNAGVGYGGGGMIGYGNGSGYGIAPGAGAAYGPGMGGVPPVLAFPSAGSYGGAPSLLPPPIFGRYDDPFYGFDPPAVVYPPWWGALNAQRAQANAAFNAGGVPANGGNPGMPPGSVPPAGSPTVVGSIDQALATIQTAGAPLDPNATATDVGNIPDGTVDMEIDGAGVATLRGGVPSLAEKLAIGQRLATTPGVTQVVNRLTVKPALARFNAAPVAPGATPPAGASNTPPPAPTPADAAPPPAGTALNPAPPAITSTPSTTNTAPARPAIAPPGDPNSDAALTDRAARAVADRAALLNSNVRVKVVGGVAQLTGKVPTVYEGMLAYRSVQQTPGIQAIEDRLVFEVPDGTGINPLLDKGRPDDVEPYLEAQVRRQVGGFAHLDRVRLQADVLEIRGILARAEDRDRFDAILRSMPILRGFQVHADMPVATP